VTIIRRAALLPVDFFTRPADVAAAELLGAVVVSTLGRARTAGRIVETEAYLGHDDPASHASLYRRSARIAALLGAPGSWYVYLSYGIHWCANLVCDAPGKGSAVLLRALEPLEGLAVMRRRRGVGRDAWVDHRMLCSGPGKLCQALGVTRRLDGQSMAASSVLVLTGERDPDAVVRVTPRVGITKAVDWPLRFVLETKRPSDSKAGGAGRARVARSIAVGVSRLAR
jgi:DNA-3-methyladenine glycosylase